MVLSKFVSYCISVNGETYGVNSCYHVSIQREKKLITHVNGDLAWNIGTKIIISSHICWIFAFIFFDISQTFFHAHIRFINARLAQLIECKLNEFISNINVTYCQRMLLFEIKCVIKVDVFWLFHHSNKIEL